MLRDYAPVPGTLIPGRAAALRVVIWREVSLLFTTGETNYRLQSTGIRPVEQRGHDWPALRLRLSQGTWTTVEGSNPGLHNRHATKLP